MGYYIEGVVTTLIAGGHDFDYPGVQRVSIANDFWSESGKWKTETLSGINYIVHDHGSFLVFSNDTDQFVISK